MNDTCFDGCRYRDKKGKYKKTCPDYIELTWMSESGQAKVTHDCARKRSLLLMMNWDQRLMGVQQASEEERNKTHELVGRLGAILDVATGRKEIACETSILLSE